MLHPKRKSIIRPGETVQAQGNNNYWGLGNSIDQLENLRPPTLSFSPQTINQKRYNNLKVPNGCRRESLLWGSYYADAEETLRGRFGTPFAGASLAVGVWMPPRFQTISFPSGSSNLKELIRTARIISAGENS